MKLIESGVIVEADVPNRNGRVYPRAVLEQMIREIERKSNPARVFGSVGMPAGVEVDLSKVSHTVSDLHITDDGKVLGKVMILDTPQGRIMEKVLEAEPDRQFRLAGIGKLEDNEDGTTTVTDFRLLSINLVRDGA
jgi:hypothetical protein